MELEGELIVPVRELNRLRREAVERLDGERPKPPVYVKREADPLAGSRSPEQAAAAPAAPGEARLTALCRTLEQVRAACETDVAMIYADFEFIKQFPAAIETARAAGKPIALATPRIHMPGRTATTPTS